tara:strand:+ start:865 stop:1101 length:237 start_codon:yes stop_codon:yes gene_type:complete
MTLTRKDFDVIINSLETTISEYAGVSSIDEEREILAKVKKYITSPEFAKAQTKEIRSTATKMSQKKLKLKEEIIGRSL